MRRTADRERAAGDRKLIGRTGDELAVGLHPRVRGRDLDATRVRTRQRAGGRDELRGRHHVTSIAWSLNLMLPSLSSIEPLPRTILIPFSSIVTLLPLPSEIEIEW